MIWTTLSTIYFGKPYCSPCSEL